MDQKKDNQFSAQRYNGHRENTQGHTHAPEGTKSVAQKREQGFSYILRKSEKLTTAVYLVTDIIADKEPMKWKIRETAVEMLSDIMISGGVSASERMSNLRSVSRKIEKIVSFLDVAVATHMMSEMNASVLKKEYLALKENIEAEWTRVHEHSKHVLNESFFELPALKDVAEPDISKTNMFPLTQGSASARPPQAPLNNEEAQKATDPQRQPSALNIERPRVDAPFFRTPTANPNAQGERSIPVPNNLSSSSRANSGHIGNTTVQFPKPSFAPHPEAGRDERRKIIFALIKQKPALTVKDIAKSISHVSEKTIQRELLAMVAEGILVKRGERRWSMYSLRQ